MRRTCCLCFVMFLSGCVTEAASRSDLSDMGRYPLTAPAAPRDALGKDAAAAAPLAAPAEAPTEAQLIKRQVIYTGGVRLVVVSISDAISSVRAMATEFGGYLESSDATSIVIRVPADRFEQAMDRASKLGEVVDRSIKAADVTEEMLDLNLRLDTARQARDRLLEHLKKSDKLEDTLKIEAELRRLTTEIEQMEGKLRYMNAQVAMSTLRVEFNTNQPRQTGGDRLGLPFPWVSKLGDGLVAGSVEAMPRQPKLLSRGPSFTPPPGFVRYFSSDDLVEAISADGLRIKVQRHANYDRAPMTFWRTLVRRALVETRSLAVNEEIDINIDGNDCMIGGTRDVGGTRYRYSVYLRRDNDYVFTFEAWGPRDVYTAQRDAISASAQTLRR